MNTPNPHEKSDRWIRINIVSGILLAVCITALFPSVGVLGFFTLVIVFVTLLMPFCAIPALREARALGLVEMDNDDLN